MFDRKMIVALVLVLVLFGLGWWHNIAYQRWVSSFPKIQTRFVVRNVQPEAQEIHGSIRLKPGDFEMKARTAVYVWPHPLGINENHKTPTGLELYAQIPRGIEHIVSDVTSETPIIKQQPWRINYSFDGYSVRRGKDGMDCVVVNWKPTCGIWSSGVFWLIVWGIICSIVWGRRDRD